MKILFTGGSSFTGYWFIRELAAAGHEVTAIYRKAPEEYGDAVRRERVRLGGEASRAVHGCGFGDERFLGLLEEGGWDVICHHASDVTNYKSPDFDAVAAVANNTHRVREVVNCMERAGCGHLVLTGSVFEGGEGAGSEGLKNVSPYGLSKSLTAQVFGYYCERAGITFGKFVIPNPFGPYEEPRFTAYLLKSWLAGKAAQCSSPAYVRDNIPVSLLSRVYAAFVGEVRGGRGFLKINPSGYVESQGAFTLRVAREMRARLGLPCEVELLKQKEFPEPRIRINTDVPDWEALGWDEGTAWDGMASYYQGLT
jgi:nucleoside-diphosphate-sugar epimerase